MAQPGQRLVRLLVPAGQGKPSPQIGQSLGSLGLNMMAFLKEFNAKSVDFKEGIPLRVDLYCKPGNPAFNFDLFLPPTSYFLKECAGVKKGTGTPGHEIVGSIHVKQIYEIAKLKQSEERMAHIPLEGICKVPRTRHCKATCTHPTPRTRSLHARSTHSPLWVNAFRVALKYQTNANQKNKT
jgi:large subunit ribosomal protein L11